jgi:hypothetical protein
LRTDDEDSRPGSRILLVCLASVLLTGAAMAVELTLGGAWGYPCAAVTAVAPMLLVRPAAGPLHAWSARRRTARARRTADSLRLEQMYDRTLRRPPLRTASLADSSADSSTASLTASAADDAMSTPLDDADTRSIDLDAIRQ